MKSLFADIDIFLILVLRLGKFIKLVELDKCDK